MYTPSPFLLTLSRCLLRVYFEIEYLEFCVVCRLAYKNRFIMDIESNGCSLPLS